MRSFHLIVQDIETSKLRRVDFRAASPDHAFQIARNEADGTEVELWEGEAILARMTKGTANVWKLLPLYPDNVVEIGTARRREPAALRLVGDTGG